jgi:hypothetical protein
MRYAMAMVALLPVACAAQQANKTAKAKPEQKPPCGVYFTVVTQDILNNFTEGLSPDDVRWFQKSVAKKYPSACYAEPGSPTAPIALHIVVTPDVYHGTRIVNDTSTHSTPVTGTVTDQNGNTSQVNGTAQTTTTTSTAVPYSLNYGIYTLAIERKQADGTVIVARRFQQKGLYTTMYGIPLGGKGHHPAHTVIEEAAKWINDGGLTDPHQGTAQPQK